MAIFLVSLLGEIPYLFQVIPIKQGCDKHPIGKNFVVITMAIWARVVAGITWKDTPGLPRI
jgi:hypothetical protein